MADPTFGQLEASTLVDMEQDIVYDEFFVESTLQRKMRAMGILNVFEGGLGMQEPFQFDRVEGGAIAPGSDVTVTQKQLLAAAFFQPKEYIEKVPINLFQTGVINSGPAAKVKLTDLYYSNAVQSLNIDLAIDFYRHGQAAPLGVADNRQVYINGASEVMNDGITSSWDGNYFPYYGGQIRNGNIGNVLNSIPHWWGDDAGNPGQIGYRHLLELYMQCVQPPDLGVCNKALFSYLLERQEPKQNFTEKEDLDLGVSGLKLMQAMIHVDKLCPSKKYGAILPSGMSMTTAMATSTFTSSPAPSAISNLPAAITVDPSEPFFFFRCAGWKIRPTGDEEYNFNFTPQIRAQTNADLVVSFLKAVINFYTNSPRDNAHGYGAGF